MWHGWRRRGGSDRKPWVIAHRGESSLAPENTLIAGSLAHRSGADAWEVDVQLTRDGVPVVLHDESLSRTTDVEKRFAADPRRHDGFPVSLFTLDEIRSLDAGAWFVSPQGGPRSARSFGTIDAIRAEVLDEIRSGRVRIPTLAEVLELTRACGWVLNIELKSVPSRPDHLLEAVLEQVTASGLSDQVWLSSFDHAEVARASRLSRLPVGALTSIPLHQPAAYVKDWVGACAYHPSLGAIGGESIRFRARPHRESLRSAELDQLRDAEIPVFVYTINAVEPGGTADILANAGVAGVFTDRPTELARRWKEFGVVDR